MNIFASDGAIEAIEIEIIEKGKIPNQKTILTIAIRYANKIRSKSYFLHIKMVNDE